jgi:hypothetical protein
VSSHNIAFHFKNICINSKINWLKNILIFRNSFHRNKIPLHNYRFNLKSWKFFKGLILKNLKFNLCNSVFHFIWPMSCFVVTPHLPHLILPWLWSQAQLQSYDKFIIFILRKSYYPSQNDDVIWQISWINVWIILQIKLVQLQTWKDIYQKPTCFFLDIYIKLPHVPSLLILTQVKEMIVLHVLLISKAFGCYFCWNWNSLNSS